MYLYYISPGDVNWMKRFLKRCQWIFFCYNGPDFANYTKYDYSCQKSAGGSLPCRSNVTINRKPATM